MERKIDNKERTGGLEKAAARVAASQHIEPRLSRQTPVLNRLPVLEEVLQMVYAHYVQAPAKLDTRTLSLAAEWILDNQYVIVQALRQIREDLPQRFERELVKLAPTSPLAGQPRIYGVARAFLEYDDYQFDTSRLERFVRAYQETQPLTMGELWALPIMLRLVLLESIAFAAVRLITKETSSLHDDSLRRSERLAQRLAALVPSQRLIQVARTSENHNDTEIITYAIPSLRSIDSQDWKDTFERVSLVHQWLSRDPVGFYTRMDFETRNRYRDTIETIARRTKRSEVEVVQAAIRLAKAALDDHSRAGVSSGPEAGAVSFRHDPHEPGEQLDETRSGPITEWSHSTILLRTGHVGYYLLDQGRGRLEAEFGYHPRGRRWLRRFVLVHPTPIYLGGICLIAGIILIAMLAYTISADGSFWQLALAGILALAPAITIAVDVINYLVTRWLPPRVLSKLDLQEGIPLECRTMVVIPALISHISDIDSLFEQLEQHYLRNRDPNHQLTFALLTDFADASEQVRPEDGQLLAAAQQRLEALNNTYPGLPFYFFHRQRLWNPSERVWMGWERKRGKLHEFNRLLRGAASETSYTVQLGNLAALPQVRYVITLDADTVLPREGAHRLIGALAHPLNRAVFDAQSGKVMAGYTILQPRTAIKPTSTNRSFFTRVFGGDTGIDLYTLAVSDVYQDLFGAGIYVGKGIYEVDAFERSLEGRVPENALLSHDLFEGIQGRVGLVTDVVLYEEYPPHYLVNVLRSHRWARGDWQLLPWLGRKAPATGGVMRNDLSLIDRWKLFDNLRRSLLPPLLLLLLVAGWTVLPGSALVWTVLAMLAPGVGLMIAGLNGLVQIVRATLTLWAHNTILAKFAGEAGNRPGAGPGGRALAAIVAWRVAKKTLRNQAVRWLLFLAFLPYEALLMVDAIGTTLIRLFVRRRKLLQWTTAARTVRIFGDEVSAMTTMLRMLPAQVLALAIAALVLFVNPTRMLIAAPFLAVWLLAWQIAFRISRPDPVAGASQRLTAGQVLELQRLARHTWLFYEQFVGPDDNWLPPDHFQEAPRSNIAHRTSPTNTGMYLLSVLAAHDFGYVGALDFFARLRSTFDTLARLDRYRGHFLNWIDTRTLEPLNPRYVSAVDSGNLAAALIALRQGMLGQMEQSLWRWARWSGLLDTLALLEETLSRAPAARVRPEDEEDAPGDGQRAGAGAFGSQASSLERRTAQGGPGLGPPLGPHLAKMREQILAVQNDPARWYTLLVHLNNEGRAALDRALLAHVEAHGATLDTETIQSARTYLERIHHHIADWQREVDRLQPWLGRMADGAPGGLPQMATNHPPPATDHQQAAWQALRAALPTAPTLGQIAAVAEAALVRVEELAALLGPEQAAVRAWLLQLAQDLEAAKSAANMVTENLMALAEEAADLVTDMDFRFLFDRQREVFHIGYNIDTGHLDGSYYDLLASEARIASLVAIAKYDAPQSHWLHLGRPLTLTSTGAQALLSWSGTSFEYLMPPLLLRQYPETLLSDSSQAAIDEQIAYARRHGVPWGISESGFYLFDASMSYQYRAFGVPGLGFKRGLSDDLVVAPYASLLALPWRAQAVMANIGELKRLGLLGRYGFYESVDFTTSRLLFNQSYAIVREYMAHHQGMILLAINNALREEAMVRRFHAEPAIQSIEMLLQEQTPYDAPLHFPHEDEKEERAAAEAGLGPEDAAEAEGRTKAGASGARLLGRSVVAEPWRVPTVTPMPLVHYLSNGRYSLMISNAGAGVSRWQDVALTRWRADTTLDQWGTWLYIQDIEHDVLWLAAPRPMAGAKAETSGAPSGPEQQEVHYYPHMAEFRGRGPLAAHEITVHMNITVAPDDDIEVRRVSLTNDGNEPRRLRITTYGEVVLGPEAADLRHPAFGKLFVESEYVAERQMLVFRRRPRAASETWPLMAHTLVFTAPRDPLTGATTGQVWDVTGNSDRSAYESDRARFFGRSIGALRPQALMNPEGAPGAHEALSGRGMGENLSEGIQDTGYSGRLLDATSRTEATLDPIMSLSREVVLAPHETVQFAILTLAAESRPALAALAQRYGNWSTIERTFMRARNAAEQEMRDLDLNSGQIGQIQKLLSLLIYPHSALRSDPAILAANRKGQSGLWAYGISGDDPILLVRVREESQGELLQQVLQAHLYWRRRGIKVDVVILNRQESNYGQMMQGYIHRLIHRMESSSWLNQRGGIYILREDQLGEADRVLLLTAARVVLDGERGLLDNQLARLFEAPAPLPAFSPEGAVDGEAEAAGGRGDLQGAAGSAVDGLPRPTGLLFDNGWGGFSPDGREYLVYLPPDSAPGGLPQMADGGWRMTDSHQPPATHRETTPAPWINVIANEEFGFLASEGGGGYSWAVNSGENRLTTWRNDPVLDEPAEALYLRDEETGEVWSPTPQPIAGPGPYLVRHGAGYSVFEHESQRLRQRVRLFVALDQPVKIVQVRLENLTLRPRRVTVTYYAEWVLGVTREQMQQYVTPEYDDETDTLLARNPYNVDFAERVAFLSASRTPHGLTADRAEFLGRLGSLQQPAALWRVGLSGRVDAGLDPCAALQLHVDLAPGASEEVYFILGQGVDRDQALALARQFQDAQVVAQAWADVGEQWEGILGAIEVETPDPAMNLLLNRWLLYQALACRIWGRSALYQSSGAYGFRDQLQDVMALIHSRPDLARAHILRAARHQFEAGDVLHWWHPPGGKGVRTRISDDLLWLPYVTVYYVTATGDESILREETPFLRGEPLGKDEEERYGEFPPTEHPYSILEHCRRAVKKGATAGPHGLPLIGGGDWNDGMNRVGIHGQGESIWLGWFLHATLTQFAAMCEHLGEVEEARACRRQAAQLREALEYHGWDGDWYRRAYYDDGTPLGSAQNQECRIDSIAQSWAVLSQAGDAQRAKRAMEAVLQQLVRWEERLLLLFTPPFDKTQKDPGYIKGYTPGVRENGGQYTHAALWSIWAYAELGDGDLADELFRLINPIYRSDTPDKVCVYKVEPYVISADVYGVAPHVGRGGWTWYTGSSGWMYRLGVEAILGIQRLGDAQGPRLRIQPRLPRAWPGYRARYRFGATTYTIQVDNLRHDQPVGSGDAVSASLDGEPVAAEQIPLVDDGKPHEIRIQLGASNQAPAS
jgi:cyclic beta-1,2-glucan synthetase